MRKMILVPDSFKGTMSSEEVCGIMAGEIRKYAPKAEIVPIPVADGGEGSVDAFLHAAGGRKIYVGVKDPWFREIRSFYGILPDGTAVIEMATAAGLPLAGPEKNAEKTTTYGVGQMILHAAESGCKRIIVGLGGSATNDGGAGAAAALGYRFRRADGSEFVPVGGTLRDIAAIGTERVNPLLRGINFTAMCDIDNPLCGPQGAAVVFAPQKGADAPAVKRLDAGLNHFAEVIQRDLGKEIHSIPGAGAAGGMGGGMAAFLNSRLKSGIDTVLDTVGFDRLLDGADFVLTGEGKLDLQSLRGKVVVGTARRAKRRGVPLIAIVGDVGPDMEQIYREGVSAIFSTNRRAVPFEQAKSTCREDLAFTVGNIMRLLRLAHK